MNTFQTNLLKFQIYVLILQAHLAKLHFKLKVKILVKAKLQLLVGGYLVIFAPITAKDLSLVCWDGQSTRGALHIPNSERPVTWK